MASIESARIAVDRAYAQVVPDINTSLTLTGDNETGDFLVGVQVELPIPVWNRNQGAIQEAHANVIAAERSAEGVRLSLRRRFEVVYQRYASSKYQIEQYTKTGETDEEKGILDKVNESIELNKQLHVAGEIKNLEMIAAQQVHTEATLEYLVAVRELWAATLEIDGLLLKDSLK